MDGKTNVKDHFISFWLLPVLLIQVTLSIIFFPIFYIAKAVRMVVKIYLHPVSWIWILILFVVWYLTGSFLLAGIVSIPIGLAVLWRVIGKIQTNEQEKGKHWLDEKIKLWLERKHSGGKY